MIHGSKMTSGQKGMRKGISLVEMLIAVVLFGLLGTISYTYYKNYYDISFASKQLRVYTIIDQAAQLSNAFDLYNAKYGVDANETSQFVDAKILTSTPVAQPFVTTTGWDLEENVTVISAEGATGVVFRYAIDGTGSVQDNLDYCNILNNVAFKESNLTRTSAEQNSTETWYAQGIDDANDGNSSEAEYFHCSDGGGDDNLSMVFVKIANKL